MAQEEEAEPVLFDGHCPVSHSGRSGRLYGSAVCLHDQYSAEAA